MNYYFSNQVVMSNQDVNMSYKATKIYFAMLCAHTFRLMSNQVVNEGQYTLGYQIF